jgi:pyruvate/2-oxoglutarate dehydrogenase complex dihydrolipoamide dehydrogenase (E3) component
MALPARQLWRRARGAAPTFLEQDYDLVVIGGGAAGIAAARAARRNQARVVLIAHGPRGAAATLALRAFVAAAVRGATFHDAMARGRRAADQAASADDAATLQREGIDLLEGHARFTGPGDVAVEGRHVRCGRFIIATGSRALLPAINGLAQLDALVPDALPSLVDLPASLAILGAGPTACELAQAFAQLGTRVTLLDDHAHVLPDEEPEASMIVAHTLRAAGVDLRLSTPISRVVPDGTRGASRIITNHGDPLTVDRVLVAVGRVPVVDDLELAAAGVELDHRGNLRIDSHLRTTVPGTYAAGDVTGLSFQLQAAEEMGRFAAEHALRRRQLAPFRADRLAYVTFTLPEVARVGARESDVGRRSRVAYLPLSEVERAVVEDELQGYIKLIAEPRVSSGRLRGGRIAGATIVAPRAGEMITEVALAMQTGMFPARLAQTAHAYPTWSSGVQKCAAQFVTEIDGRRARRAQH